MDKQLTSVCNITFFVRLKLFSQLAQTSPGIKQSPSSAGLDSAPAARLEPDYGLKRKNMTCLQPCQEPHKPRQRPSSPDTGQTQPQAGSAAQGSAGKTGCATPPQNLYRAALGKSYLTSWPEFPCDTACIPQAS